MKMTGFFKFLKLKKMKKVLLVVVVMLMGVKGWAWGNGMLQVYWNGTSPTYWYIDTVNYPNNKWQVGIANKVFFNTTQINQKTMITDTINQVPANDTSVFYLKFPRSPLHFEFNMSISYAMVGDSNDYGTIEVSPDNGSHWVDILKEDSLYQIIFIGTKPKLRGYNTGLIQASMNAWQAGQTSGPVSWTNTVDTVLIRFTYITGNGSQLYDGWMFGDINIYDWHDGINDITNESIISIAPNPVEDVLHIKRKIAAAKNESVQVMNMMGEVVFSGQWSVVGGELSVDVSGLAKGVYLLRYSCDNGEARERFVKE